MSIATKAMIVNLQIHMWLGYKQDKQASDELTMSKNASSDAARVNTHLVSKTVLNPVKAAAAAVRLHFYSTTLPWKDNGDRLLTRHSYMKFMERHAELADKFWEAVNHFVDVDYPSEREAASFRMGELFDRDAYPNQEAVRRKFYLHVDVDTVSTANDFRVQLDQEDQDRVRHEIETAMNERVLKATYEVWRRLHESVLKIAELSQEDRRLHKATIENLDELLELIPGLNISDDQNLLAIREEVKTLVGGISTTEMRKDKLLRKSVADDAQRIIDSMAGFMKAFPSTSQD